MRLECSFGTVGMECMIRLHVRVRVYYRACLTILSGLLGMWLVYFVLGTA
jgi:hypothetical protein